MTTIEGGMITTNDPVLAKRCQMLRNHGSQERYLHESLGFNFRMTDVSAAIGLSHLTKLKNWNEIRKFNAKYLTERLSGVPGIFTPRIREGASHIFHQYTVRVSDRDKLIERLTDRGIGYGIYYPIPIHQQPLYRDLGYTDVLPQTEKASQEVLSLPIHPSVSKKELHFIADTLISLYHEEPEAAVSNPSPTSSQ
jgi:perosamine synthetase